MKKKPVTKQEILPAGLWPEKPEQERAVLRETFREWTRQRKAKKAEAYPINWPALRKTILARDGYVCRICGVDACESALHVHHVDWSRQNNSEYNLVTLCKTCHSAVHTHNYRPDGTDDEPWGMRHRQ